MISFLGFGKITKCLDSGFQKQAAVIIAPISIPCGFAFENTLCCQFSGISEGRGY